MSEATAPVIDGQGSTSAAVTTTAAPAPTPTSTQVAPPPAPAGPTAGVPWLGEADDTTLGYVANKGWTEPKQVLDGYRNLEKLLGADKANNAVIIPKEGADPKEWASVYDRLGRPTGADGYKVEMPAGGDPVLQGKVFAKMHELGLSKTQGEELTKWFNGMSTDMLGAQEAARVATFATEDAQIKSSWGQAYTQNLAVAQTAARGLGMDNATIDKMSLALGHKGTMELLHKIGSKMGEPDFVAGDNSERFGSALTPGQAKATIESRMADREWVKKYQMGGMQSAEFKEMQRLQAYAHPEG